MGDCHAVFAEVVRLIPVDAHVACISAARSRHYGGLNERSLPCRVFSRK